jgi:hypothetical protein
MNLLKVLILFLYFSFQLEASPIFSWEINPNYSALYINQILVYDSRDKLKYLPNKLNTDQLSLYSLLIGEYFIVKNDKENFNQLTQLIQTDKNFNSSLLPILQIFQKLELSQEQEALSKLEDRINSEENPILNTLSKVIKYNIKKKNLNADTKESIKNLNCVKQKSYYGYCRILKLRLQLENLLENSEYPHRDFLNIDRVIAPFFEEEELFHISFLNHIVPDLSAKLAHLGFAFEAVHFQKMIVTVQKATLANHFLEFEKLAYYQLLADDLNASEETLNFVLKNFNLSNKNTILLKLIAVCFHKKDYKQALNYGVDLNFKNWNAEEKNPFFQDTITVNGAKELIAIALWKTKSPVAAVKALNQLGADKSDTEENLFLRLRIAQIIMAEKPETAEKMSEDILYKAQSNAWKRVEYAATLMNGYCNILTKKYRKATVQFTKAYGILGENDPSFSSEWLRGTGMLFARIIGGERGNHSSGVRSYIQSLKIEEPSDEILMVKNYLDSRFDTESFFKLAVSHFGYHKNFVPMVETLYTYQRIKSKPLGIYNKTILQLPDVHKRIRLYRGLRPNSDQVYYKGDYQKLRENESIKLINDSDKFDFKESKDPIINTFSFNEKIYVISYDLNKKWNLSIHNSIDYRTSNYYEKIFQNINFLDKTNSIQIFLNPLGMDLFQAIRKINPNLQIRFFYSYTKNLSKKNESDLIPCALNCESNADILQNGINFIGSEYFEGTKPFQSEDKLHIWNIKNYSSKDNFIDNFEWKCGAQNFSFQKFYRRSDLRTTPYSIYINSNSLPKFSLDHLPIEYYLFSDFWMRKGVKNIYFTEKMDSDKLALNELSNVLIKSHYYSEDYSKIHGIFKNFGREILILTKELK